MKKAKSKRMVIKIGRRAQRKDEGDERKDERKTVLIKMRKKVERKRKVIKIGRRAEREDEGDGRKSETYERGKG